MLHSKCYPSLAFLMYTRHFSLISNANKRESRAAALFAFCVHFISCHTFLFSTSAVPVAVDVRGMINVINVVLLVEIELKEVYLKQSVNISHVYGAAVFKKIKIIIEILKFILFAHQKFQNFIEISFPYEKNWG